MCVLLYLQNQKTKTKDQKQISRKLVSVQLNVTIFYPVSRSHSVFRPTVHKSKGKSIPLQKEPAHHKYCVYSSDPLMTTYRRNFILIKWNTQIFIRLPDTKTEIIFIQYQHFMKKEVRHMTTGPLSYSIQHHPEGASLTDNQNDLLNVKPTANQG